MSEVERPALPAAVLWDMDGTLVDTEPYWIATETELVESYGNEWPEHHAHAIVGFDLLDAGAYIKEHGNLPLEPPEIVDRLLAGVIAKVRDHIPWRPGARELLADCVAAGIPCALVTMSWRNFAEPIVEALPPGTFQTAVTGDMVERGKPHPDPYLYAAERLGVDPTDCVAIEDSPTGVRSAVLAGCQVIGVPNVKDLDAEPNVTIVGSLADVEVEQLSSLFVPRLESARHDHTPVEPVPVDTPDTNTGRRRVWMLGGLVLALIAAVVTVLLLERSDEQQPIELPPGAVPVDAWAPYWTLDDTIPEAGERLDQMREISQFWYGARGVDEIVIDENASTERIEEFDQLAADSRARVVPSIRDQMAAGEMAAILADPDTRTRHVEAIMEFADEHDADGIDLDYEQFAFADGGSTWASTSPNWVAFVEELATELHDADLTLTISIPPVYDEETYGERGYWVYDHGVIAQYADAIRIMAYDFSVAEAGPIAPLDWVQAAVDGVSKAVPEEYHDKLVLGIPAYGGNWVVSTSGECPADADGNTGVTARSVGSLAVRRDGIPEYDTATGEWFFSYELQHGDGSTLCTQQRKVHWVDAEGARARIEIARRAGWGGVALWALGYEDQAVWDTIIDASRTPIPADPDDTIAPSDTVTPSFEVGTVDSDTLPGDSIAPGAATEN